MIRSEEERPSPENKRKGLFLNQKQTLDIFLANGAISQAQYDRSLGDLIKKMRIETENQE